MQKVRGKSRAIARLKWGVFGEDGVERRKKTAVAFVAGSVCYYWPGMIAPCKIQIVGSKME